MAAALLREAAQAGVTLRLVDGKPTVSNAPSAELLARLRENKPEIVAVLKGEACRWCGERLPWPRPAGIVLDNGLAECMRCADHEVWRLWAAAERVTESADTHADDTEAMLKGMIE